MFVATAAPPIIAVDEATDAAEARGNRLSFSSPTPPPTETRARTYCLPGNGSTTCLMLKAPAWASSAVTLTTSCRGPPSCCRAPLPFPLPPLPPLPPPRPLPLSLPPPPLPLTPVLSSAVNKDGDAEARALFFPSSGRVSQAVSGLSPFISTRSPSTAMRLGGGGEYHGYCKFHFEYRTSFVSRAGVVWLRRVMDCPLLFA